jgi:hypothetical protein
MLFAIIIIRRRRRIKNNTKYEVIVDHLTSGCLIETKNEYKSVHIYITQYAKH